MLAGNYKINSGFIRNFLLFIALLPTLILQQASAASSRNGAGSFATDVMEPVSLFGSFVHAGCMVLGISFVFASLIKYIEHRRSPLMVPISTVVFLLVAGSILLLIPLFSYYYNTKLHLGL